MKPDSHKPTPDRKLPAWFADHLQPLNTDFGTRVVCSGKDMQWLPTGLKGVDARVMEYIPGPRPRLAAQLRLNPDHEPVPLGEHPDLEILIQKGKLDSDVGEYKANWYFRLPDLRGSESSDLHFQQASATGKDESALLYLAAGQMKQSDTEWREIDTADEANWFPGPVEGTDVLPLHGHGFGNVMLVRWNRTVAFKTRIDPRGEELLVLSGAVYDAQGFYPEGSWIRNPIAAWQSWGAKAGTLVYYKNGHFADSDLIQCNGQTA